MIDQQQRHQSFAVAIAACAIMVVGAIMMQPAKSTGDDERVVHLLEVMQAHHNRDFHHPILIEKNTQGEIDELRFYLEGAGFTIHNELLRELTKLPSLETLIIFNSTINGDGLRWIREMPRLKRLMINDSPITDAGLQHLESLPNLRQVQFSRTAVTYECAQALHNTIPHCEILDSWCCGCMTIAAKR